MHKVFLEQTKVGKKTFNHVFILCLFLPNKDNNNTGRA